MNRVGITFSIIVSLVAVSSIDTAAHARHSDSAMFTPVRLKQVNAKKVWLGRYLFYDRRLSRSGGRSCASCHDLSTNGATGTRIDRDDSAAPLSVNTPTVFNTVNNFRLGWNGKHRTVHDLVYQMYRNICKGERIAPRRYAADPAVVRAFRLVYASPPSDSNIVDALTAFMSSLVTPDAPFDRWLKGDADALSAQQLRGYTQFRTLGCASCHQGVNIGGNLVERRGIFHRLGSGKPGYMRVPSLRNVAVTAPYFHDGSAATLSDAIYQMGVAQLNVSIPDRDLKDIAAFLRALTGKYEGRKLRPARTHDP